MTKQALNSLNLYKGGNPSTILMLLNRQSRSVVDELKQHFGVSGLNELSVRLSIGH